jgi:hypothetical protein
MAAERRGAKGSAAGRSLGADQAAGLTVMAAVSADLLGLPIFASVSRL